MKKHLSDRARVVMNTKETFKILFSVYPYGLHKVDPIFLPVPT